MYLMLVTFFTYVVVILFAVAFGIMMFYKLTFYYWKRKNFPIVKEPTFPFGNFPNVFSIDDPICVNLKQTYDALKSCGCKMTGWFICTKAAYIIIDKECMKNILQKDFNYFTDRGFYYNEKDDPLSANLFALGGEKWRNLRTKLSPAYTSGKLKTMFDCLLQCTFQLQDAVENNYQNGQIVNIMDISECFTIDVIGSCAFGIECNSFKNPDAEFRKQGKNIFYFEAPRVLKTIFAFSFPDLSRWLGIKLFNKEITNFFINMVKDSLKFREVNNFVRKDFLQLLLELKSESNLNLSIEELTAQVFIFFAAGFETSSITLTFCLYELSQNSYIQNKVREEIVQVLANHKGKMTYEAIMDMKYLNQVLEETLRKYPPVPYITRVSVKDYQMPGTEIVINKGMDCIIPIFALHRDSEYYPNPEKFDPERFSDENKQQRLPFTYMPFGEGPRICIGLRFGLMQVKAGLAVLLRQYRFSLNNETKIPLQMKVFSFTFSPKNPIFLNVEKVH